MEFPEKLPLAEFTSQSLICLIVRNRCWSTPHGDVGVSGKITARNGGHFRADSRDLPTPDVPHLSLSRCRSWLGQCIWVCLEKSDQEKEWKGQTWHKVGVGQRKSGYLGDSPEHGNTVWSRTSLSCLPSGLPSQRQGHSCIGNLDKEIPTSPLALSALLSAKALPWKHRLGRDGSLDPFPWRKAGQAR